VEVEVRRVIRPVVAGAGLGREIGADLQDVGLERLRVSGAADPRARWWRP